MGGRGEGVGPLSGPGSVLRGPGGRLLLCVGGCAGHFRRASLASAPRMTGASPTPTPRSPGGATGISPAFGARVSTVGDRPGVRGLPG